MEHEGMVHALQECRRVLKASGGLIDIRPLANDPAVEILTDSQVLIGGQVDDSAGVPDDEAANQAIGDAARRGDFVMEEQQSFELAYYWERIDQMKAYFDERWGDSATVPTSTLENAARLISEATGPTRIRVRLDMLISRYSRQA
jgi:hypothetical protein